MSDTRQVVSWALERKCLYRNGENWLLPEQTFAQLADLRTVADAETDGRVVDGICVTSWSMERDYSGNVHDIPESGFRIEQRLAQFNGLAESLNTCGQCEANADSRLKVKVAGCCGYVDVSPDSPELNEQLWKVIENGGLEERLRSAFDLTTPLWYGFWINSPLRRLQAELLHDLLDAVCDYDDPRDNDVVHFLNALKAAIDWELPLHVSLAPLGHTDFGWYTVFPHCPRCKANASVGRWKDEYPTEPYACQVCGHTFIPNEHHSSKHEDIDWNANSLEKQLGKEGHEQFVRSFLRHRGCTEEQVEQVIDNRNNGPVLRRVAEVRTKRNATYRRLRPSRVPDRPLDELPRNIAFALTDDIPLELVLVPSGELVMGSPETEEGHCSDEAPQHLVRFSRPFYIGRFPITQIQWQAVMGRDSSRHKGDPDLPVDRVSWLDCQEFCEVLCARQNRLFRLPSESEWEYACRAGTTTMFAFGDVLSPEMANFTPLSRRSDESLGDRRFRTTPVGTFPPNSWGIYDMHGNVEEWCEDVWHDNYEGSPVDGTPWLDGEGTKPCRVLRGGWCSATEAVCRSASRRQHRVDAGSRIKEMSEVPGDLIDMLFTPKGFRVVCEVP